MGKKKKTIKDVLDSFFRNDPRFDEMADDLNKMFESQNDDFNDDKNVFTKTWTNEDNGHRYTVIFSSNEFKNDDLTDDFFKNFDLESFVKERIKASNLWDEANRTDERVQSKDVVVNFLKDKLNDAIDDERYEDAAKLRDIIKNHNNKANDNK